jgi:outer membrane protein OmpA-like peptidoglycan-associated protein/ABC-type nitrate/sulfonate/bicarbonate transport system substrate-binding protein
VSERSAKRILTAAFLWILIFVAIGALYKFIVHPRLKERTQEATSSASRYNTEIALAADSFSGYSVFRSDEMRDLLAAEGIRLEVRDDGADYNARLQALQDGDVEFAVFTVDSLVSAGARLGEFPGTIVMVVDESKGADAVVAYENALANIEELNDANAAFVLTPDSPSEFLARVAIANFNLPNLPENWYEPAKGSEDVYRMLKAEGGHAKRAFVLWEPYVSRALENSEVHTLIDSSNLRGLIVDVLVAERSFLRSNPELATKVVESYLRALYRFDRDPQGLTKLFVEDARKTGSPTLTSEQAGKLRESIQLKNTLENYAHFGLLAEGDRKGLTHIEDAIGNISRILVRTGVFEADPMDGNASTLFYDRILRQLQEEQFHPASLGLVQGIGSGTAAREEVRGERELVSLSEEQWSQLVPVGTLSALAISFARGTARINIQSQRELDELASRLESLPRYYLRVIGHTRVEGNVEANRKLARQRADAATGYLLDKGINPNRIRAEATEPEGGAEAQSVTFWVGQMPY